MRSRKYWCGQSAESVPACPLLLLLLRLGQVRAHKQTLLGIANARMQSTSRGSRRRRRERVLQSAPLSIRCLSHPALPFTFPLSSCLSLYDAFYLSLSQALSLLDFPSSPTTFGQSRIEMQFFIEATGHTHKSKCCSPTGQGLGVAGHGPRAPTGRAQPLLPVCPIVRTDGINGHRTRNGHSKGDP